MRSFAFVCLQLLMLLMSSEWLDGLMLNSYCALFCFCLSTATELLMLLMSSEN